MADETHKELLKYLNNRVVISYNANDDRPYTFKGEIIKIGIKFLTINEEREGEVDLVIERIIKIKME